MTPEEKQKYIEENFNLVYKNPTEFVETKKFKNKLDEFRNGDWRKGSGRTYVTLETEIPPMPTKIIEKPDETKFRSKQFELTQKIDEL